MYLRNRYRDEKLDRDSRPLAGILWGEPKLNPISKLFVKIHDARNSREPVRDSRPLAGILWGEPKLNPISKLFVKIHDARNSREPTVLKNGVF